MSYRKMKEKLALSCCCFLIFIISVQPIKLKFMVSGREFIPREDKEDDMPDAFIKVTFNGSTQSSNPDPNNQYPQWSKVFEIDYEDRTTEIITVSVLEDDIFPTPSDEMGTVYLHPWEIGPAVERRLYTLNMYQGKLLFTKIPSEVH